MHNFFFTTSERSLAGLWSITLFSLPGSLDSLSNKKQ